MKQPYPFRRLFIDRMTLGGTQVWWQFVPEFNEPLYEAQLQVSHAGTANAADWENVGPPEVGSIYALDASQRDRGMLITASYRVVITAGDRVYASAPETPHGILPDADWTQAREIVRKEQLRLSRVGAAGRILKRRRFGPLCTRCRDRLTEEVTDQDCPECRGTGFQVGYHAPVPCACFDLSPQTYDEKLDGAQGRGSIRDNAVVTARILAFPALQRFDVWVNEFTDERWAIHQLQVKAALRGVPLVVEARMHLIPFSDVVYRVEVGGEPADPAPQKLPGAGGGSVTVDHDYGGEDNLAYQTSDGCGITGATILAFSADDWDGALPAPTELAIAASQTLANGRWAWALKLDPGDYRLVFDKPGESGPDVHELHVVRVASPCSFWDV